ncbi:hypothetical protein HII12_002918 [Brettanomyces bruxellensis]|uniref:Maintenance of mitochondrial morphology protein 1 n=1 Tax=Dekkera bruxellensis TaxID=5007 RepID=A0A8H6BF15_DEKBR|nr:hypothetical protein HII12_002918 [Brettanomyces bruxellensis]
MTDSTKRILESSSVIPKKTSDVPPPTYSDVEKYLSSLLQNMQREEPYTLSLNPNVLSNLKSGLPSGSKDVVTYTPAVDHSSKSFTRGFMLGQLSVIIIIVIFIRFFIFSEAEPANSDKKRVHPKISGFGSYIGKTYYDVDNHQPESLDWFNVLLAQFIMQVRREALIKDNIYHSLDKAFNDSSLAEYTDKINITEVNIGNDFPILSNCRIINSNGRIQAKIDVDVSDTLTLAAETSFLINSPKPMTASLPVQLKVSIVRFSGCLTLSLVSISDNSILPKDKVKLTQAEKQQELLSQIHEISEIDSAGVSSEERKTAVIFSFAPDFRLEFDIKSLIGSKAKLEDMPRIRSIIENALRKWLIDRYIQPRFHLIRIPGIWSSQKKKKSEATPEKATKSTNQI